MRLGVDGRELTQGVRTGIGRYLAQVIRAASHAGWACVVYADQTPQYPLTLPGVTLRVVEGPWTMWWDQVSLPRHLAQDRISVFLSPYYKSPVLAPCPVILTVHDLLFIRYPGSRNPCYDIAMTQLAKLYASRAHGIITDSEFSKQSIVSTLGINAGKIRAFPVALPPSFHPTPLTQTTRAKYNLSSPYILYIGNFKPHKNLVRLLEAYAHIESSIRNTFRLVVGGRDQDNQPALQGRVHTLGLDDHVQFTGHIEDEDLPSLYSGASLLVLPSLVEGFGLTALEAMGCGCPVAASNRAAIPEVVGEAAVLFDPENVESIGAAMTKVLTQPALQHQCTEQGLVRAQQFSPDQTTARVLDFLKEIVQTLPLKKAEDSALPSLKGKNASVNPGRRLHL